MSVNLIQKEKMLLQDQKNHEQICIQKYSSYAQNASDPQLKELFKKYAGQEQNHLNTINQILSGQTPSAQGGQQGQQQGQQSQGQGQQSGQGQRTEQPGAAMQKAGDAELCTDMLMTEKYVSDTYNTAIFECTDSSVRQALNHIQKEEQQHGEGIFNYMNEKGLYSAQ